jgi:hypothetical protein
MKIHVLSAAVLAAALGAGAVAAQDQRYSVTVHRDQPSSGFEKVKVSKAAVGDTQIVLWANTAINPDCTPVPGVTLSILKAPEHGKATVSDDPAYLAYPPGNPRSACNNRKIPGHRALYQADAGYSGRDHVVLQGSSPEGRVREINVDIQVR